MIARKPLEDQLIELSERAESRVEIQVEPTARWVRAVVGGIAVADSKQVLTVKMGLPVYYFPRGSVRADLLERSERRESHSALGERSFYHLRVGDRFIEDAIGVGPRFGGGRGAGDPRRGSRDPWHHCPDHAGHRRRGA